MKSNGHWDDANEEFYVSILANPNTMKTILDIENNYQVNFKSDNSLRKLLGFNSKNIYRESRIRESCRYSQREFYTRESPSPTAGI